MKRKSGGTLYAMIRRHAKFLGTFTTSQLRNSIRNSDDWRRTPTSTELTRYIKTQSIGKMLGYKESCKRDPTFEYLEEGA